MKRNWFVWIFPVLVVACVVFSNLTAPVAFVNPEFIISGMTDVQAPLIIHSVLAEKKVYYNKHAPKLKIHASVESENKIVVTASLGETAVSQLVYGEPNSQLYLQGVAAAVSELIRKVKERADE